MTEEELNERFAQLAEAVSRVAEASTRGMERLSERIEQVNSVSTRRMDRLLTGQLALQRLGGQLSEVVLEIRAEVAQLKADREQNQIQQEQRAAEIAELRQRQAETDARFNVLLDEIRFLIRRQFPEEGQS
jgi:chromosome segregation ATPase